LDLSNPLMAMAYMGATILVSNGSAFAITLPTTDDAALATQLMGWNIRVVVLDNSPTPGPTGTLNAAVTIVRADASNDFIIGRVCAADGTGAAGNVTVSSNVVTFGAGAVNGDYVDIVCLLADTTNMTFLATGMAST